MSHNPKSIVKPKQKQSQQNRQEENKQTETTNEQSENVPPLSIEEQLEYFADLLIDLYLLDQQPSDHED